MEKKKTIGYQAPQYFHISGNPEDIPEVKRILEEFTEIAKNEVIPQWYVKNAALYFTYEGKYYMIGPGNLKTDSRIFDGLCHRLIDRLYEIGAYDMFDACMLD